MPLFFTLNFFFFFKFLAALAVSCYAHRPFSSWGKWKATLHGGEKPSRCGGFS